MGNPGSVIDKMPTEQELKEYHDSIHKDHFSYVVRFIIWKGLDQESAKDVVQEAYLRAWRAIRKIYGHADIRGWLCKTARFVMCDELMRRKREGVRVDIDINSIMNSDELDEMLLEDLRDQLRELYDQLSPDYREIIYLNVEENLSLEQCAKRLNISLVNARARSSRAKKEVLKRAKNKGLGKDAKNFFLLMCHF